MVTVSGKEPSLKIMTTLVHHIHHPYKLVRERIAQSLSIAIHNLWVPDYVIPHADADADGDVDGDVDACSQDHVAKLIQFVIIMYRFSELCFSFIMNYIIENKNSPQEDLRTNAVNAVCPFFMVIAHNKVENIPPNTDLPFFKAV